MLTQRRMCHTLHQPFLPCLISQDKRRSALPCTHLLIWQGNASFGYCECTLILSLLFTGWPPGVLGWVRGGSGRLLLLGLLRVLPLLGMVVRGLPGSLGGRFTIGPELGLSAAALEGPCDVLPVVAKAPVNLLLDRQW